MGTPAVRVTGRSLAPRPGERTPPPAILVSGSRPADDAGDPAFSKISCSRDIQLSNVRAATMTVLVPAVGAGSLQSIEADATDVSVPEASCAPF